MCGVEMEENSSSNNKEKESINGVADKEEDESLKKIISGHPLFTLLLQAHLNCLKVGLGEVAEVSASDPNELNISTSSPDLDLFMEGYCMMLRKLREAIEEPVEETASFIKAMHIQLEDLNTTSDCGSDLLPKPP